MPLNNLTLPAALTSITPVWGCDTTPPALGNGVMTAGACRIGPLIYASIEITFGSTTTFGSGPFYFTLPAPFNPNALYLASGSVGGLRAGVAFAAGTVIIPAGENKIRMISHAGPNQWTSAIPYSWANTDYWKLGVWIPVA